MTTVEKRKLSISLSELQGNQLTDVLNIIADNLKDINPDDEEEIELDVDQLDNATLWRLREYCDTLSNKHVAKSAAPAKAGGGGASRSVHDNGKQQQHGSKPPARTESGSESDRYSAEQDVKGSNMVEQPQSNGGWLSGQAQPQAGRVQGVGGTAQGDGGDEAAAAAETRAEAGAGQPEGAGAAEDTGVAEDAGMADGAGQAEEAGDEGQAEEAEQGGQAEEAEQGGQGEEAAQEAGQAEEVPQPEEAAQPEEAGSAEDAEQADADAMEAEGEGVPEPSAMDATEQAETEADLGEGGTAVSGGVEEKTGDDVEMTEQQSTGQPNFVKNQRTAIPVDESATAPKDKPAIATDKKSNKDVVLNASAWQAADEDGEGGGEGGEVGAGGEEEGDDLWDSFRSVAEREKQQKAEEDKRRKELEQERERERLRVVAEARQAKEEEERKMREAEEAAAAEAKRAKDEARQKELEELQMQANTAQVYQPPDAKAFSGTFGAGGADINDLGLMYKHDDDADDVGFDD
ncbi:hypothetical protein PLESTM_001548800 [Pleodorina starrii]|nr:hypothetical protein PLESTM_001548800 [Pleodorina starrii]